jgi:competence ComEA-like helix-hairpin-helix protein
MNLQPSNRRQDVPVRLGSHGYRLDGDTAHLNAELHVPPYCAGSNFGLELWACSAPHAGGAPRGVKIAEISLELPTPIGPHIHRVEARAAVTPPAGEGDHSMVLVLVGGMGDARRVHDFANYNQLQHFASPRLEGAVGYAIEGNDVVLSADGVANPRPAGNSSGSLCLELWALPEPYVSGAPRGHRLAGAELGNIFGQHHIPGASRRAAFTAPPAGRWHVALLLREWTLANGYVTRDFRNFDLGFDQTPPQPLAEPLPASTPAPSAVRPPAKLRLIEPADEASDDGWPEPSEIPPAPSPSLRAPASAAPAAAPADAPPAPVATGKRLLNVQTATLEELSKLPGVSLKVAKEIVKRRPFATLDALIEVRGIGEKTLRRIKALLTL